MVFKIIQECLASICGEEISSKMSFILFSVTKSLGCPFQYIKLELEKNH